MKDNQERNILMMNLRAARLQKGLTQTELSKRAGVELSLISRYEQCKATPRRETLKRIADVLDCNVDWLLSNHVSKNFPHIDFEELRSAALPLVELLRKKGHPHMTAVVTERSIHINEDIIGVPLDYDD